MRLLRFSDLDIQGKLRVFVLATVGAALLLAGMALVGYHMFSLREMIHRDALTAASMIGANSASALLFHDPKSAEMTLSALSVRPRFRVAALYDKGGALFARFFADGEPRTIASAPGSDGISYAPGRLNLFIPVEWAKERVGTLYLSVDLSEFYRSAAFFTLLTALVLLSCLGAAYALGLRLQGLISRPILDLAETARAVSKRKDYSLRAPSGGRDEVGLLAEAFNEMLVQIQVRDVSLLEARADLEKRVEERTLELAQQARNLAAVNKELETFSYSVAHDLRAPLRSIDGFSKQLLDRYADKLDTQGQDFLQRVCAATQRMGNLIDGLLALSRLSRLELQRERVDLSALARRIVEGLQQSSPERRVEFVIAPGLEVSGDASLLEAVLANLLGNAWKFTGRKSSARIEFGITRQDDQPAYFISDDGAGFDMAHANKLFGPFQRLHAREEFPGSGIGLATVKRILKRHGGHVWADSVVGKGSTFYFTLPWGLGPRTVQGEKHE